MTLGKTMSYWYKTFSDHAANTHAIHEDMANLYPADQSLSVAVAKLNNTAAVFQEVPAAVEELRKTFDPPLAELLAKLAELATKAQERAVARSEIEHYKEKVTKLANEGKDDAKKQSKAESNQAKCARAARGRCARPLLDVRAAPAPRRACRAGSRRTR